MERRVVIFYKNPKFPNENCYPNVCKPEEAEDRIRHWLHLGMTIRMVLGTWDEWADKVAQWGRGCQYPWHEFYLCDMDTLQASVANAKRHNTEINEPS